MACEVQTKLGERSYSIAVGAGALEQLPAAVKGLRGWVVTDFHVNAFHGERVMKWLGKGWKKIVLTPGEGSKSPAVWADLLEQMAAAKLDRESVLIALGGGVVGDVTGFAAATYMRGIRFIQVPTTLLAMVDSAVGGKTGINLAAGKNLAGAFHQPIRVIADTDLLATLPEREFNSGLIEVIKYGVTLDANFFEWLESHIDAIHSRDAATLETMIAKCCEIKSNVVSQDEREGGDLRAILNFGHTLGHAIEKATNYSALLHGEAVGLGMIFALSLSCFHLSFPVSDGDRMVRLLCNSKAEIPMLSSLGLSASALCDAMAHDKKAKNGRIRFVLCRSLGKPEWPCNLPRTGIMDMLRQLGASP